VHAVDVLAFHHVLQVPHDGRRVQIPVLENERLVHVQGKGKGRLERFNPERRGTGEDRNVTACQFFNLILPSGDVGQAVNDFGNAFDCGV